MKRIIIAAVLLLVLMNPLNVFAGDRILSGNASWYSSEACRYNPDETCPTASGRSLHDLEAARIRFAAMWDLPFGTTVEVTNVETGWSTVVTILDRGPARRLARAGRIIDLGKHAFADIADLRDGIVRVKVRVLS